MTKKTELAVQQNSTEIEKPFSPTIGMIKWFEAAIELGYTASISEVAEHSKLDRSSWYKWLEKPGFVEWWDFKFKNYLLVNRWKLDAIGMKQAEKSYDFWLSMMERVGNISPDSSRLSASKLTFREIIAEKWDRYGQE